jgi:hypothetical protein
MLRSPVPKQSLASSKQNLSCRDVFCVLQINGFCDNVVQLPKPQDYICHPHDVAAGSNDLFVCEIYITPRSPAPSDLCASPAALVGLLFVSPLSPEETGNNNGRPKHDDNDRCNTHHDASPNNAKMHYKILPKPKPKPTDPLIRGL